MARPSNVLGEARSLIEKRLSELNQERQKLEKALASLAGGVASGVARRGPGRPKGVKTRARKVTAAKAKAAPVRRRKRRGGTRREQALALIKSSPGITASEIAKQMKIAPNYVYRVMGDLQKDKSVSKKGRGFHAT
jgi:DNA-binding CsgD family transcriptional regulator